jgi:hypothetical protein
MKTFKIEIPEGYEINQEKSTFEKIVFKKSKKLPKTWEELEYISGAYVSPAGFIRTDKNRIAHESTKNTFLTAEQAKAAIALAQLSQLREVYRNGWVPDWTCSHQLKHSMILKESVYTPYHWRTTPCFLTFQSKKIAQEFFITFAELIEQIKPLMS